MAAIQAVGIDLGTTFSSVAVFDGETVTIIADKSGNKITPSVVAFTKNGRLIGETAKNQRNLNPTNTIYGIKRIIGKSFEDVEKEGIFQKWPFKVFNSSGKPMIKVEVNGKTIDYHLEEISSMVIERMKQIAENHLNCEVQNAVITVPAAFDHNQRQATIDAANIAGLNVLRIINEPTAAAIAYGMQSKQHAGRTLLVFDMGGGTLDVTILKVGSNEKLRILNSNGENHLGGEDFDMALVSHCVIDIKKRFNVDIKEDVRALSRLKSQCTLAKIALSSSSEYKFDIDFLSNASGSEIIITRELFDEICSPFYTDAMNVVDASLQEAKLESSKIDDVILVGGSTYICKIEELIRDRFPKISIRRTIHPEEAVAYGAAIMAAKLQGTDNQSISELIVVDVASSSLGMNVLNDQFHKIIYRNSPIPRKEVAQFQTSKDNQTTIDVSIFKGEGVHCSDNDFLGQFDLVGIPANKCGMEEIDVTFDLDENGILSVEACHRATGLLNSIKITNRKCHLDDDILQEIIERAQQLREQDLLENKRMEAIRSLEDFAYAIRNQIIEAFDETINWIKDNRYASVEEVEIRLSALRKKFDWGNK